MRSSRRLGVYGGAKYFQWEKFNVVESTNYIWNKYSLNSTATYYWDLYNIKNTYNAPNIPSTYTYGQNPIYTMTCNTSVTGSSQPTVYTDINIDSSTGALTLSNSYAIGNAYERTVYPYISNYYMDDGGGVTSNAVLFSSYTAYTAWNKPVYIIIENPYSSYYRDNPTGSSLSVYGYYALGRVVSTTALAGAYGVGILASLDIEIIGELFATTNNSSLPKYYLDNPTRSKGDTFITTIGGSSVSSYNRDSYGTYYFSSTVYDEAGNRWSGQSGVWFDWSGCDTPTSYTYSKGTTSYGTVTSTNRSAYPDNNYSGSYWYVYSTSNIIYSQGTTSYGIVKSKESDTYPANGKHTDNYWYVSIT